MGGAQPLAVTMNEGVALVVEVDRQRIARRIETGYLDTSADTLEEAMTLVEEAVRAGRPLSVGLLGNAAEVLPELLARGVTPDIVTDQTSAHDPLNGYAPAGLSLEDAAQLRERDPQEYVRRSRASMAGHVEAILALQARGAIAFDYGNNLRGQALEAGVANAFDYPGFVPAFIRPLFCQGKGPFRWVALSGDPADIARTDRAILELFPDDEPLHRWITKAQSAGSLSGLAGAHLLAGLWRARPRWAGLQRAGAARRGQRADRDRPRSPGRRLGRIARTARPRACAMDRMRSAIGRF